MVDLTAEQVLALRERFGSLAAAGVAALQDGMFADEFAVMNVWVLHRIDAPDTFYAPRPLWDHYEPLFWRLVWATHEARGRIAAKPGAPELGIPERELFWILERRLENSGKASREWLALETKRRDDLEYVPRDRLSPLVDWADAHQDAARHMLSLRRIPPEFRAGKLGWVPPGA